MAVHIKLGIRVLLGGALALGLLVLACGLRLDDVERDVPGPRTLTEVAQIAAELGLYYRSDIPDQPFDESVLGRLIVSERPLPFKRVRELRFKPGDQRWNGTVAVTWDLSHGYDIFADSIAEEFRGWVARWGDFFLFGDPALIRRLTGSQE
jgi:hypothetical protein